MTTEINAAAPTARLCPNCGEAVAPGGRGLGRTFCNPTCREAHNARTKARGAVLAPLMMAWMLTRHAEPGTEGAEVCRDARREVTAICKAFNREDKRKGRPPADVYARELLRPRSPMNGKPDDRAYADRSPAYYADRTRKG